VKFVTCRPLTVHYVILVMKKIILIKEFKPQCLTFYIDFYSKRLIYLLLKDFLWMFFKYNGPA